MGSVWVAMRMELDAKSFHHGDTEDTEKEHFQNLRYTSAFQNQSMPTSNERFQKLSVAAALVMFDKTLRSVSNTIFYYAIIIGLIGGIVAVADWAGWIFVGLGVLL